jgi:hypothetical protein
MSYCKQCGTESIDLFCSEDCKNKYENPFGTLILECIPELTEELVNMYKYKSGVKRNKISISMYQNFFKRRIGTYLLDPIILQLFVFEMNRHGYIWENRTTFVKRKR